MFLESYSYTNISAEHGIPVTYRNGAFVSNGVTGGCHMGDVGNPECFEVVPHDGQFGRRVKHRQPYQGKEAIAVTQLLGNKTATIRSYKR